MRNCLDTSMTETALPAAGIAMATKTTKTP
jgi:hypothetical protein